MSMAKKITDCKKWLKWVRNVREVVTPADIDRELDNMLTTDAMVNQTPDTDDSPGLLFCQIRTDLCTCTHGIVIWITGIAGFV
jgi:hypothetical protein